jgi:Replication-relaxation
LPLVAAEEVPDRIRDDALLFTRWTFAHRMEVNDFFCTLTWATRRVVDYRRLTTWWSEGRCIAEWDGLIRPDGFARLDGKKDTCRFLLELDRGTERGPRLADKLQAYAWFGQVEPGAADAVLFLFPTHEREVAARAGMSAVAELCVATSMRDLFYSDPLGPVWLPMSQDRRGPLLWLPLTVRGGSTR